MTKHDAGTIQRLPNLQGTDGCQSVQQRNPLEVIEGGYTILLSHASEYPDVEESAYKKLQSPRSKGEWQLYG